MPHHIPQVLVLLRGLAGADLYSICNGIDRSSYSVTKSGLRKSAPVSSFRLGPDFLQGAHGIIAQPGPLPCVSPCCWCWTCKSGFTVNALHHLSLLKTTA